MSFGTAFAFREDLSHGKVYDYRFNTKELKAPLTEAALAAGWGWKGGAFGSFEFQPIGCIVLAEVGLM